MHKLRLLMIAMALAAVLYVKFFVNLNDIAGVAVDGPTATTADGPTSSAAEGSTAATVETGPNHGDATTSAQ